MALREYSIGTAKEYLSGRGLGATSAQVGLDKVTDNAKEFSRQLEKLASFVSKSVENLVIKKTCFDLYMAIVERTPVATGRAKTNWSITAKAPGDEVYEGDESLKPFDKREARLNADDFAYSIRDDTITIYNNLEYIEALENGHSQQAPAGMVAVSLAEFNIKLERNIKASGLI